MNSAQLLDPGEGIPGVVKPNMPPQQNKEGAQLIMSHVAQVLANQGPFGGWKADVPIKTRAMNVYQMITSLRLIQPRIDLNQAAQAAVSFEQNAFQKATTKSDYEKECNEKLAHIKDTRQKQVLTQLRQQQQQQQQAPRAQQLPGNSPLPDDLNNLSPQELHHVTRLANAMRSKISPEDLEKVKLNLLNMNPDQRHYLARKKMDPMTYFFRAQALTQIRRHKRAKELDHAPNAGIDPDNAMTGDPAMNLQRNSMQTSPVPGQPQMVAMGNVMNDPNQQQALVKQPGLMRSTKLAFSTVTDIRSTTRKVRDRPGIPHSPHITISRDLSRADESRNRKNHCLKVENDRRKRQSGRYCNGIKKHLVSPKLVNHAESKAKNATQNSGTLPKS